MNNCSKTLPCPKTIYKNRETYINSLSWQLSTFKNHYIYQTDIKLRIPLLFITTILPLKCIFKKTLKVLKKYQ